MSDKDVTLIARFDRETKAAFVRRAKAKGVKPGELLRRLVLMELEKKTPEKQALEPDPEQLGMACLNVRMPAFIKAGANKKAEAEGMPTACWIAALVQSNLMADPVLTVKELRMLEVVGRELNAVGRNVNQIARHINAGLQSTDPISFESLNNLPRAIANARQAIDALVIAKHRSWGRSEE